MTLGALGCGSLLTKSCSFHLLIKHTYDSDESMQITLETKDDTTTFAGK